MKKKRKKKSTPIKLLEFTIVYLIITVAGAVPMRVMKVVSSVLGNMLFFISSKRRNIAVDNIGKAFGKEKNDKEIRGIARESCGAFFFTFLEIIKFRHLFKSPWNPPHHDHVQGYCNQNESAGNRGGKVQWFDIEIQFIQAASKM